MPHIQHCLLTLSTTATTPYSHFHLQLLRFINESKQRRTIILSSAKVATEWEEEDREYDMFRDMREVELQYYVRNGGELRKASHMGAVFTHALRTFMLLRTVRRVRELVVQEPHQLVPASLCGEQDA